MRVGGFAIAIGTLVEGVLKHMKGPLRIPSEGMNFPNSEKLNNPPITGEGVESQTEMVFKSKISIRVRVNI